MITTAGKLNVSVYFYIVGDAGNANPGEPVTGLLFSDIETGGSASYMRQGAARVDLTLITLASASAVHADGGFILVDDTNMPGVYRCDFPDAAFATGVDEVTLQIVIAAANNAVAAPIKVQLTDFDLRTANVTLAAATHTGAVIPTVTNLTGHTAQTGDSFARIGVAGAGLTDLTINAASVDNVWDEVLTGAAHNVVNSAGRRLRIQQETGTYAGGLVWLDTVNGFAGTTDFENGTEVKPVNSLANANTMLGSVNLGVHGVHNAEGNSITFVAAQTSQEWTGEGWTLALGGQNIATSTIKGATVSGVSTGVPTDIIECFLNDCTWAGGDFTNCAIAGNQTLSGATMYHFFNCHHASVTVPIIDFGAAVGATTVHLHGYHGAVQINNMGAVAGADVLHFDTSGGKLILDSSCVAGTVNMNGTFELVDNSSGMTLNNNGSVMPVVNTTAGIATEARLSELDAGTGGKMANDVGLVLADTNELQTDWTDGGRLDLLIDQLITQIDTAAGEPAQGAPPVSAKMASKIDYLYKAFRNKKDQTSTLFQIYNDAGTVVDQKATVSDVAGTTTTEEIVSGP